MDPVVTDDGITAGDPGEGRHAWSTASTTPSPSTISAWSPGPTHTNVIFDAVVPLRLPPDGSGGGGKRSGTAVRALDGNYYAVVNVEHSYT